MNLYLITRTECDWGEMQACVVAAGDAIMAREVASKYARDEGAGPWVDHLRSTVVWIGTYDPRLTSPDVILTDVWEG